MNQSSHVKIWTSMVTCMIRLPPLIKEITLIAEVTNVRIVRSFNESALTQIWRIIHSWRGWDRASKGEHHSGGQRLSCRHKKSDSSREIPPIFAVVFWSSRDRVVKEELELVLVVPEDLFVDIRNFSSLRRENTRLLVGYFSANHTKFKHRRSHKTFAFPADRRVSRSLPPSFHTLHTHHSPSNAFPKYNQLVNMTGNLCRDAWSHCSSPTYSATSNHELLFKPDRGVGNWLLIAKTPTHYIRGIYPRQQRLAFCS